MIVGIIVLALCVAWTAFCVSAEYALVSSSAARLRGMADGGSKAAIRVLDLKADPMRFISATQVGITMAGLAAGAVAEPAVQHPLEDAFGFASSTIGEAATAIIGIAIAFGAVTALTVVLGEIIPKTFTLVRPERVAVLIVNPLRWFVFAFGPFIIALDQLARMLSRLFRLPPPAGLHEGVSLQELRVIVDATHEEGQLDEDEHEMIRGVFDLGGQIVRQVMVPRPNIVTIHAQDRISDAALFAHEKGYSRYLVIGDDVDDVRGYVHIRDLLGALVNGADPETTVSRVTRPAMIIPETKKLDLLLDDFRASRSHLAVILSEYGALEGIVTLEDVVEEVVGEIRDEHGTPRRILERAGADGWIVDATLTLEDLFDETGLRITHEDATVVSGVVLAELGHGAQVGDVVTTPSAEISVLEMDGVRPSVVRITPAPQRAD